MQDAAFELLALLVERRQRLAVDRDQVLARDEQVHLAQRLRVLGAMPPRAVEHEEDVVAVVVELGALTEVLGVLERQRVKTEQLVQAIEVLATRGREVQPEEVVALRGDRGSRLVDAREARHDKLKPLAYDVEDH